MATLNELYTQRLLANGVDSATAKSQNTFSEIDTIRTDAMNKAFGPSKDLMTAQQLEFFEKYNRFGIPVPMAYYYADVFSIRWMRAQINISNDPELPNKGTLNKRALADRVWALEVQIMNVFSALRLFQNLTVQVPFSANKAAGVFTISDVATLIVDGCSIEIMPNNYTAFNVNDIGTTFELNDALPNGVYIGKYFANITDLAKGWPLEKVDF